MPVTVKLHTQAINKLIKDKNGPVTLHVSNVTRSVLAEAVRLAPRGTGQSGSMTPKKGKRLHQSGRMEIVKNPKGSYTGRITFDADHAAAVILGAKPHPIDGSPYLKFYWDKRTPTPGWVRFKGVNHPGNTSNNFLEQAMINKGLKPTKIRGSRPK